MVLVWLSFACFGAAANPPPGVGQVQAPFLPSLQVMKKKLKRLATSLLPVAENRVGSCNRCGECCKLPYPCPFLRYDEEGLSKCAIYHFRPPSCRKYPRTAEENLTAEVCGFSFAPSTSSLEVSPPDPLAPLVPVEQSA